MAGYSEALRSIGQALEAQEVGAFELKVISSRYVIQDVWRKEVPSAMRRWFRKEPRLVFTVADVKKLSEAGRAQRSQSGRLTDFKSLANLLRTIGAFLDFEGLELLALEKRAISLTLAWRDKDGNEHQEDRTVASFYRTFLELCQRRSERRGAQPR
jgi:hypothetical protein